MGIGDRVKSEMMSRGMKAVSKIMEDPARAEKVMKAVETVQKSRERMDETTQRLLNIGQLPSRDDVKDLARQAGRLRREAKKVLAALDDLEAKLG